MVQIKSKRVCIGVGSNLGYPARNVLRAVDAIRQIPQVNVLQVSRLQETAPLGRIDQPRFINSVMMVETTLSAIDLFDRLQTIEKDMGRSRTVRWGPRTIDLDILLYADEHLDHPRLKVPHPEMGNRPFIQTALNELGVGSR